MGRTWFMLDLRRVTFRRALLRVRAKRSSSCLAQSFAVDCALARRFQSGLRSSLLSKYFVRQATKRSADASVVISVTCLYFKSFSLHEGRTSGTPYTLAGSIISAESNFEFSTA